MSVNVELMRIATEAGAPQAALLNAYRNFVAVRKQVDEQRKQIDLNVSEIQEQLDFTEAVVAHDENKETATLRIEGFQVTRTITWKRMVDVESAIRADRSKSLAKALKPYRLPVYDVEKALQENPSLAELLAPYQRHEYDVETAISEAPALRERLAPFTSVNESVRYTPTLLAKCAD